MLCILDSLSGIVAFRMVVKCLGTPAKDSPADQLNSQARVPSPSSSKMLTTSLVHLSMKRRHTFQPSGPNVLYQAAHCSKLLTS